MKNELDEKKSSVSRLLRISIIILAGVVRGRLKVGLENM